jgi:hypothetical protein
LQETSMTSFPRFILVVAATSACAASPGAPPVGQPSPALRAALADTLVAARVYLPQDVTSKAYRKLDVGVSTTSYVARTQPDYQHEGPLMGAANDAAQRRRGARSSIAEHQTSRVIQVRFPPGTARVRAVVEPSGRIDNTTVEILSATDPRLATLMMKWLQSPFEPGRDAEGRPVRQLIEVLLEYSRIAYRDTLSR